MRSMKTTVTVAVAVLIVLGISIAARAADNAKDLEPTPQAKAYRAMLKAIEAGDYEGYKKSMIASAGKELDAQVKASGKPAKDLMAFLKKMVPGDIKLSSLKVEGKKATLEVTGKRDAESMKGSVDLAEESGQWKVNEQSWMSGK